MSEKLPPNTREHFDWFYITPDDLHIIGMVANGILSLLRCDKRARVLVYEDIPQAWGIYTPEEARDVAKRLSIDPKTDNFFDPKLSKNIRMVQRGLGLIG